MLLHKPLVRLLVEKLVLSNMEEMLDAKQIIQQEGLSGLHLHLV